jgi:hypothetical protein
VIPLLNICGVSQTFNFLIVLMTEQKEKLTEVEQQLKRAEALQRRRMQVEKANRESEVYPVTFTCTYIFFSHGNRKDVGEN